MSVFRALIQPVLRPVLRGPFQPPARRIVAALLVDDGLGSLVTFDVDDEVGGFETFDVMAYESETVEI